MSILRVLLIEDVEADAELTVRQLERDGFDLHWLRVETADAMRDAVQSQTWDLVISDYSMPTFSSVAALDILKQLEQDIPFVIVSGTIDEATVVKSIKAGARDYFAKGQLVRLAAAIERELKEAELRRKQRVDALILQQTEMRFNAFMNSVPTPAWIKDENFCYVYVNVPYCRLFGIDSSDIIGRTDFDFMPEHIAQVLRKNDQRVLMANFELRTMETVQGQDGEERIFAVFKFPVTDKDGGRFSAGIALDITERIRAKEQLESAHRQLRMLSAKILEIQERERKNISRGLHDDIGQALTAIKIHLEALRNSFSDADELERIDESTRIVGSVLHQVRELSIDLRPPQIDDLGLTATLRWYVDRKAATAGLQSRFLSGTLPDLHPDIEIACFRIVQEAVTNILRHAQATNIWVELRTDEEGRLRLIVRDDGNGFDVKATRERAARGESLGLINMQERAALVGGVIKIDSGQGATVIDVMLPIMPYVAAGPVSELEML